MRLLVLAYYHLLRKLLRDKINLHQLLTRCRHCRILFLTDPRNRNRQDLGCPFGCAEVLRKKALTARTMRYYRTPGGRKKKKLLNTQRYRKDPLRQPPRPEPPQPETELEVTQTRFNPTMVSHLTTVATLVEGRRVRRGEILQLLHKIERQRRIAHRTHLAYAIEQLKENPP